MSPVAVVPQQAAEAHQGSQESMSRLNASFPTGTSACRPDPSARHVLAIKQGTQGVQAVGREWQTQRGKSGPRLATLGANVGGLAPHIPELVEYEPDIAGTCDARRQGRVGRWATEYSPPFGIEWLPDAVHAYQTGKLTNSGPGDGSSASSI
jgi:hypothetical protein